MSESSSSKHLLRQWLRPLLCAFVLGCLIVQVPVAAELPDLTALVGSPLQPIRDWETNIAGIERKYAEWDANQDTIVFIGSSSIVRWNTLEEDFADFPVINAGFGGSHIIDSVYFLDRLVIPFAPRTVVLFAGSNDISGGKQPTQVLADYIAFVEGVHAALPQTAILFISISPSPSRWTQHPRVEEANHLIELYTETDDRLGFIDVYSAMLGPDGKPQPDLYIQDNLHLSPKGYELWVEAVGPYLRHPHHWVRLDGPHRNEPVHGPVAVKVRVAPDMAVQHVSVTAGDIALYAGDAVPAEPLVTPYLPDGVHDIALAVTDQYGGVWRRFLRVDVRNATIVAPVRGANLRDTAAFKFATGYTDDVLSTVKISLAPIRSAEVHEEEKIVLYEGARFVHELTYNTLDLDDGTYELRLVAETVDGHRSEQAYPVIVRNWNTLSDPFTPPQTHSWLGTFDRKKTISESEGWDYATDNADAFSGDDERRDRKSVV